MGKSYFELIFYSLLSLLFFCVCLGKQDIGSVPVITQFVVTQYRLLFVYLIVLIIIFIIIICLVVLCMSSPSQLSYMGLFSFISSLIFIFFYCLYLFCYKVVNCWE